MIGRTKRRAACATEEMPAMVPPPKPQQTAAMPAVDRTPAQAAPAPTAPPQASPAQARPAVDPFAAPDVRVLVELREAYPEITWSLPGDELLRQHRWVEGSMSPTTPQRAAQCLHVVTHFATLNGWQMSERDAGPNFVTQTATGTVNGVPVAIRATVPRPGDQHPAGGRHAQRDADLADRADVAGQPDNDRDAGDAGGDTAGGAEQDDDQAVADAQ